MLAERRLQRALVDAEIGLARRAADIEVAAGLWRRQADLESDVPGDGAGGAQPLEDFPGGECGLVVAGLELDSGWIDARLEAQLLDLAHDLAVPLDELVGRHRRIDLHGGMVEQHLALEIDPAGALAGLAVRHAAQEGTELVAQAPEHLLAVVERNAADQVEAVLCLHHATFSSFCSERRYFGTGTSGWVPDQLV